MIFISDIDINKIDKEELHSIIFHLSKRCLIYKESLSSIYSTIDDLNDELIHSSKVTIDKKTIIDICDKIMKVIPNLDDDKITGKSIVI